MNKKALLICLDAIKGLIMGILMATTVIMLDDIVYRLDIALGSLFIILALPAIEESLKFLPLKSSLFKSNYILVGLMIGLGFGIMESAAYLYYFFNQVGGSLFIYRIGATLLHTITGGVMGFFVQKKKGWLGLLLAILIHFLFNLLL